MKDWKFVVGAAIVALGLCSIGCGISSGLGKISSSQRVVSVRGLAEREVKADHVTWPIVYNVIGNDLTGIYSQIEQTNERVVSFLTSNGLSKDDITAEAPSIYDRATNNYSNERFSNRYNVTCVVLVSSENVDLVDSLIKRQGELMRDGISLATDDYQHNIMYEFNGLNGIKPEMIAEATKNARAAAKKFADDSDSSLGKIQSAVQGQFSINDRDQYTPQIKTVRVVTSVDFQLED